MLFDLCPLVTTPGYIAGSCPEMCTLRIPSTGHASDPDPARAGVDALPCRLGVFTSAAFMAGVAGVVFCSVGAAARLACPSKLM